MNTRSRPSGPEVRSRLLDAAETLLADRRPGAITSRDIARTAGLSDGVLYNHFADKGELVLAALVRRFERLTSAYASGPVPANDRPLIEGIGEVLRRAHAIQVAVLPMLANLAGDPPLLHRLLVEIHRPPIGGEVFSRPVRAWLEAEQAAGHVRTGDLDALVDLVVGASLLHGFIDVLGHRPDDEARRRVDAVAAALVPALLPPEGDLHAPRHDA